MPKCRFRVDLLSSLSIADRIKNRDNGDIAVDFYHRYKVILSRFLFKHICRRVYVLDDHEFSNNKSLINYKLITELIKIMSCEMQEDVKIMKEMNLDAFRFSISWSRLLPSKLSNIYIFYKSDDH